ncbi:Ig-like domain-containing protein [Phosphitispora fastidiosa]|uniref:Ig-like domain-containing protein n=1 Tax=Phosphitispora fastidiosa TaxID=2837202 RepID=UPI001E2BFA1A|nr:Ig-like domain-containing protein [Phosphitispora fastidiosa]MBU7005797.1 hypothetical protein [Phosphitispora fastidiosa]
MRKEANLSIRVLTLITILITAAFLTMTFSAPVMAADTVAPAVYWEESYGDSGADTAYAVTESVYDNSYVFAGATENEKKAFALKVDKEGRTVWANTFDNMASYGVNVARAVYQTADNGFILAGYARATWYMGNERIYLVKIDEQGNLEWEKRIFVADGTARANGFGVLQASDGGYIVVGSFLLYDQSDIYICKTDSQGEVEWEQSFGGGAWDYAYAVSGTRDNGFIVAGHMELGRRKLTLIKFGDGGGVEWQQNYESALDSTGKSVKQTTDGGYVVTGYTGANIFLTKVDASGNKLWERTYSDGIGYSVDVVGDGGYVITGRNSMGIIVIRTDKSGNKVWEKTLESAGATGFAVDYTADKNFVIGGESGGDAYLAALEPEREALLEVSSPNVLADGNVLVYTVLKEEGKVITTGAADLKIKVPATGEEVELKDQGTDGDMAANDGVYSAWYQVIANPVDIDLYLDDVKVDSTSVKVATETDLAVVTDLQALWDEYKNTGMAAAGEDENDNGTPDYYDLLGRINRYAFAHDGIVFDMSREITTANGYAENYADQDYLTADVYDMGKLIDAWVNKVGQPAHFKNVAIIGDDKVIPFIRRDDPIATAADGEHSYPGEVGGAQDNLTLRTSLAKQIMTDMPYGSYENTPPNNQPHPRLDAGVGRVFTDRPDKLIEVIDAYEETIVLNPADRTAVLYSLKQDTVDWPAAVNAGVLPVLNAQMQGGNQVIDINLPVPPYTPGEFYHYDGTVVNWSAGKVADAVSNAEITMFWSHADHKSENTQNNPDVTAATFDAIPESPGHLLINTGCHSGYSVSKSGTNAGHYDDTMAASLMEKKVTYIGASTYGIGAEPQLGYHDLILSRFLDNVLNGTRKTVGEALVGSYTEYWTHIQPALVDDTSTYTTYGTMLYGLPTQALEYGGTVPLAPVPGPAPASVTDERAFRTLEAVPEEQALTINVPIEIPNFKITTDDNGKALIEVPNGGTQTVMAFAPSLPLITKSYLLPSGSQVTRVHLTDVTTSVYADPLDLKTTIPINRTHGPLEGAIDLPNPYPGELFWWSATEQNGGVLLTISIIPVQYDTGTQLATLYHEMEFQVDYSALVSATTLDDVHLNGSSSVSAGSSSVPFTAEITTPLDQTLGVFWMVKDPAGRVLESGSGLAELAAGTSELELAFDTLGWAPGPKDLTVALIDTVIRDVRTMEFTVSGIDISTALNKPAFSPADTTGVVQVEVRDETGALVEGLGLAGFRLYLNGSALELQSFAEISAGTYEVEFTLGILEPGAYLLKVDCSDGSGASSSKSLTFRYQNDLTPPRVAAVNPPDGAKDVSLNTDIVISFNEPVILGSGFSNLSISAEDNLVGYSATFSGNDLILNPDTDLVSNTMYNVSIPAGVVEDLSWNVFEAVYSFSFTTVSNTDASLTDIKIGGETVSGFAYDRLAYDVVLPYGTTEVPLITVTPGYAKALYEIIPAADVRGTAEIKVTAEDGIATQTYIIYFSVAKNSDATLSELKVGSQTVLGFPEGHTSCFFILPYGTTEVPPITAVPTDSTNARYEITPPGGVNGTAVIMVTAEDSITQKTYTIKFSVARNNDANLKDLQIDGQTVTGFSAERFSYVIELPEAFAEVPQVTALANDPGVWVETTQAPGIPGTAVVSVTAADGVTTRLYSVTFSVPGSTDASLADIKVAGVTIPGFAADRFNYEYILPAGATEAPLVSAAASDPGAKVGITQAAGPEGTATIIVTAEDGTNSRTYSVIFRILENDGALLSDLRVDGIMVSGFSADRLNYEVTLPFGTTRIPQVSAIAIDLNASVTITQASEVTGTAVIAVVSQDGRITREYTVSFMVIETATADLVDITVNGDSIEGFSTAQLNYQVVLPAGTVMKPVVGAVAADPQADVDIFPAPSVTGTAQILVTSSDGRATKTYSVTFDVAEDPSAALSDLRVNGTTVPGFSPDTLTYEVLLPAGTTHVPEITAESVDPGAEIKITRPENLSGLAAIVVTSRDGRTSQTYSISFRVIQFGDASLSDLKVNGITLTGFSSGRLNYDAVLPYGTTEAPLVSAVTADPEADPDITQADDVNGTATVVVTSADGGLTRTYTVSFSVAYRAPVISSTLAGTVLPGEETSFTAATTANSDAGELVRIKISLADPAVRGDVILKYKEVNDRKYYQLNFDTAGVTWFGQPAGFPLGDVTSDFMVTFMAPGDYGYRFDIVTFDSAEVLASAFGTVRALNNDAALMDLSVDGTTVAGFAYDQLSYEVVLPYGTTAVPLVSAVTADENAAYKITQADSVTGTAIIVVTAEDGLTTETYTISFKPDDPPVKPGGGGGGRPADTAGPVVVATIPAANHPVDVNVNTPIHIRFNEQIQAGTAINNITIKAGQEAVQFSYRIEGVILKLIPADELASGITCEIQIPAGAVKDKAGNGLVNPYSFSFTTQGFITVPGAAGPGAPFSDVSNNHWAVNEIVYLHNMGIVSGFPDQTFRPQKQITRGELAVMMAKLLQLDTDSTQDKQTFRDVSKQHWGHKEIEAATQAGVMIGYGNGLFKPDVLIKREELVKVIVNALNYSGAADADVSTDILSQFSDGELIPWWAREEAAEAVGRNMVNGISPGVFGAGIYSTRDQVAVLVYRLIGEQ